MESNTDNTKDPRPKTKDPRPGAKVWSFKSEEWYRSAITTAIVCAVFALIVLVLFVTNYVRGRIIDAKWEIQSENLKIELREHPDDQELLLRIRQLDLEFRQHSRAS
jgi:hypothetical protein